MRRLFWTFPDGLPGAGLLLMRLATGSALVYGVAVDWHGQSPNVSVALSVGETLLAMFLLAGLATPFWGAGTAVIELWRALSDPGDVMVHGLLATLGASLALLGAGAASVDAWIFGWRRIDIRPPRRRDRDTPLGARVHPKRVDRRHE